MIVYRVINSKDYENKSKEQILKSMKRNSNLFNTHVYDDEKDYIHFFKYNAFAKYFFELGIDENNYEENNNDDLFMIANIPEAILDKYKGFGFYIFDGEEIPIPEYAIPKEEFDNNYVVALTKTPMDWYNRKNEDEEYKRYLELVKRLKKEGKDVNTIAIELLKTNLEELLVIDVNDRTEKEFQEEPMVLSTNIGIVKNIVDETEECKRRK